LRNGNGVNIGNGQIGDKGGAAAWPVIGGIEGIVIVDAAIVFEYKPVVANPDVPILYHCGNGAGGIVEPFLGPRRDQGYGSQKGGR